MTHDAKTLPAPDRPTSAAKQLASLTAALTEDLDAGVWVPGPLERSLAARVLTACAGDGQITPVVLRETLWEGSLVLTYTADGRLARLLAQLVEVTSRTTADSGPSMSAASRLLERTARG
ncbi:hypothetical protein C6Y14_12055 [Streptomyces dioscori]|uniref:Uncharacterized protein n=1 Tax=Streptomyces dioscori TaxID=2109333 RepID=A0A2P8QAI7_9ACTN|nr:hypothetical protein [Streptomyces dioscori]PSM43255.1 hypothetical protein C6Y14_12055 [Streptomyces dioscori]